MFQTKCGDDSTVVTHRPQAYCSVTFVPPHRPSAVVLRSLSRSRSQAGQMVWCGLDGRHFSTVVRRLATMVVRSAWIGCVSGFVQGFRGCWLPWGVGVRCGFVGVCRGWVMRMILFGWEGGVGVASCLVFGRFVVGDAVFDRA